MDITRAVGTPAPTRILDVVEKGFGEITLESYERTRVASARRSARRLFFRAEGGGIAIRYTRRTAHAATLLRTSRAP